MQDEDARPKRGPLKELATEDLEPLSVVDLEGRIALLEAEIGRARRAIAGKQSVRSAAEKFFRSH